MHKLKRRKTTAQQAKRELQLNAAIRNDSGSDEDLPNEACARLCPLIAIECAVLMPCLTASASLQPVDPSRAYDALLNGLTYREGDQNGSKRLKLRHKPSAAASLSGMLFTPDAWPCVLHPTCSQHDRSLIKLKCMATTQGQL